MQTLITAARVLPTTTAEPITGGAVPVEGSRIVAVGPEHAVRSVAEPSASVRDRLARGAGHPTAGSPATPRPHERWWQAAGPTGR